MLCVTGSVTVQLSSLENQESVDEHYPMVAVGGMLNKGEVGSLRFRAHYKHQVLLPQAEYTSLKEVSGASVSAGWLLCYLLLALPQSWLIIEYDTERPRSRLLLASPHTMK